MTRSSPPPDAPRACATGKIRLYVREALGPGAHFTLPRDQSHYAARVMRAGPGDPVLLFNGKDGEWRAVIASTDKRSVTVRVETRLREQDTVPDLTLLFAPVKRARLDFLAQKATELGVRALRPVFTRRTIVKRINLERMEANAGEAAEQCGRLTVPEVLEPVKLTRLLEAWPAGHRLLFCDEALPESAPARRAREVLSGLGGAERTAPWSVLIGPEGGFAPEERDLLHALRGSIAVSLGPRIMRADTAAIAALALWQAHLGDW
ncbi:MAG: 16S rRNA (uracil(1498)-N(3))-methyltransferase [bacterium]